MVSLQRRVAGAPVVARDHRERFRQLPPDLHAYLRRPGARTEREVPAARLPSPLADRDYSATFDRTEGPEGFRVWWHAVEHPAEPPHPGVIRLSLAAGQWELRPDPLGTRVVYTWEAEMSGDIAEWIQGRARTINGVEVLAGLARAANVAPLAAP